LARRATSSGNALCLASCHLFKVTLSYKSAVRDWPVPFDQITFRNLAATWRFAVNDNMDEKKKLLKTFVVMRTITIDVDLIMFCRERKAIS